MKELKVRLTFLEEVLGTASADKEIHKTYIASNAPDAPTLKEEIEALGEDEVVEKSMAVFPKENGVPIFWDYQIKGFFKDSCGMLRKVFYKFFVVEVVLNNIADPREHKSTVRT